MTAVGRPLATARSAPAPVDALRALDPAYPDWLPVTSPPGTVAGPAVDRLAGDLDGVPGGDRSGRRVEQLGGRPEPNPSASGHDAEAGWDGLVPFADMPRALDAGCGWIATANNKPTTDDDGPFISADFPGGYRAARIGEVLASRADWDADAMARLQLDVFSIPWRQMKDAILAVPPDPARAGTVTRLLTDWDGCLAADSAAATVFELQAAELASKVAYAKAPRSAAWALGRGFTPLMPHSGFRVRQSTLVRLLREQPDGWFAQPWPQVIAAALETVQQQLTTRYGPSPARWAWGEVRPLRFLHPAGARRPLD
jgi:penicillin amidase